MSGVALCVWVLAGVGFAGGEGWRGCGGVTSILSQK